MSKHKRLGLVDPKATKLGRPTIMDRALAQRYGALASLRLERITGGGGTRATVRLPLTLDEDADADDA